MNESAGGRDGGPEPALAKAHARFARAAMAIYLATGAVGIGLLVTALDSDRTHQKSEARRRLALETQLRAESLARHLHLLVEEMTRLGLRSEVDLLDRNLGPEQDLLRLSHEKSTFFNVGVAILGRDGEVAWSEPRSFLAAGLGDGSALVADLGHTRAARIVPGRGAADGAAVLYVASPVMRNGQFTGALLGAIDLVSGRNLDGDAARESGVRLALATREGRLIYPPGPVGFEDEPSFKALFPAASEPVLGQATLQGRDTIVASAPVQGTDFTLLSLADSATLFGPARARFVTRLVPALTLASAPLLVLVVLLRRSLRTFRRSEEEVLRNERLRSLGEAVDLIAHEVKNSLNGLRVGLGLVLHADRGLEARNRQAVAGLQTEIERLSNFTTELLSFSKGVVPRPVALDLGEFVRKVAELGRATADNRGIVFHVQPPPQAIRVMADPSLIHVVIANLVGNALDFAGAATAPPPRVVVRVEALDGVARVRVADNGPGVAEFVKARLFEPFVTGKPNGVGIGLALSRKIARAHGGDLTLEDAGPGAAFHLTLPLEAT